MHILIAEDESSLAHSLKKSLEAEGHDVSIAFNGLKALEELETKKFDALLLDWRMPKLSGLEVCRTLRQKGYDIPIILITALSDISNKIEALDAGADDYITKPFSFAEVYARLKAVIRRSQTKQSTQNFGPLTLDLLSHTLKVDQETIKLPEMEFELLRYLIDHKQMIVTKEQLARDVWKLSFLPGTNFIEVTIKNLRKKLDSMGLPTLIKTIYGEGYSIIDDEP